MSGSPWCSGAEYEGSGDESAAELLAIEEEHRATQWPSQVSGAHVDLEWNVDWLIAAQVLLPRRVMEGVESFFVRVNARSMVGP